MIEEPTAYVDERVSPPLRRRADRLAFAILAGGVLERGLDDRAALGCEVAVETPRAIELVREVQPALLAGR